MTVTPNLKWSKLSDGWHVEIISGATLTRCKAHIPTDAPSSDKARPTHCNVCRLHWKGAVAQAKEAAKLPVAPPRPAAATTSSARHSLIGDSPVTEEQCREALQALINRDYTMHVPPQEGDADLVIARLIRQQFEGEAAPPPAPAPISEVLQNLRAGVAALRAVHGRDSVRRGPWGVWLDAVDSGADDLHPDDQASQMLRWSKQGQAVQIQGDEGLFSVGIVNGGIVVQLDGVEVWSRYADLDEGEGT